MLHIFFGPKEASGEGLHLLLTGQTRTLHGVVIVRWQLMEELPAPLQGSGAPGDGPKAFR